VELELNQALLESRRRHVERLLVRSLGVLLGQPPRTRDGGDAEPPGA